MYLLPKAVPPLQPGETPEGGVPRQVHSSIQLDIKNNTWGKLITFATISFFLQIILIYEQPETLNALNLPEDNRTAGINVLNNRMLRNINSSTLLIWSLTLCFALTFICSRDVEAV